jgi:alkylated DNA repair dioxygenase AlkB
MNQLALFQASSLQDIPGLNYFQHYGYKYDYKSRKIGAESYLGPIPYWLGFLCDKLVYDGIFAIGPNQVIINEYLPGQAIAPHIDCVPCFADVICSLSLGSACVMDFSNKHKNSKLLEARSLIVLSKDARYLWKHSIAARKSDGYNNLRFCRERRVSLTFRTVNLST